MVWDRFDDAMDGLDEDERKLEAAIARAKYGLRERGVEIPAFTPPLPLEIRGPDEIHTNQKRRIAALGVYAEALERAIFVHDFPGEDPDLDDDERVVMAAMARLGEASVSDVAAAVDRSQGWVRPLIYALADSGKLDGNRVGRGIRYRIPD